MKWTLAQCAISNALSSVEKQQQIKFGRNFDKSQNYSPIDIKLKFLKFMRHIFMP